MGECVCARSSRQNVDLPEFFGPQTTQVKRSGTSGRYEKSASMAACQGGGMMGDAVDEEEEEEDGA